MMAARLLVAALAFLFVIGFSVALVFASLAENLPLVVPLSIGLGAALQSFLNTASHSVSR